MLKMGVFFFRFGHYPFKPLLCIRGRLRAVDLNVELVHLWHSFVSCAMQMDSLVVIEDLDQQVFRQILYLDFSFRKWCRQSFYKS